MSKEKMIRDSNRQEVLKENFSGSIVCKKLKVPVGIKFQGHVIAEELYVQGEFDGYAEVAVFYSDESAVLDGTIIAGVSKNKSLDQNVRINTRLYKMVKPLFSTEASVTSLIDTAVQAALAEAKVVAAVPSSSEASEEFQGTVIFGEPAPEIDAVINSAAEQQRAERVRVPSPELQKSVAATPAPALAPQSILVDVASPAPKNGLMTPLF